MPASTLGGVVSRPSRAELQSAYGRSVPDLVGPDLPLLLVGINPGLWSGWYGVHFGNPANRLWPTLYAAGLTPRRLHPSERDALLASGIGITNLVNRATARADELLRDEIRAGVPRVAALVERWQPGWVAVLGLSAYRVGFDDPRAGVGRQERTLAGRPVWLLPNPSGLNAHYPPAALAEAFGDLRRAVLVGHETQSTDAVTR